MHLDQDRVPSTLEEALALLDSALTTEEKGAWANMTAARMFNLQFKIAATLRTDWSLEISNTPLRLFFHALGLNDPNEVSLLLIDAYWRSRNHEAIPVEELVREYLEE